MILWLSLLGCGAGPSVDPAGDLSVDLPDGELSDLGDATAPDGQVGRDRHRMTVPQLADSIERVTGLRWMDGDDDQFEEYSASLGVPDWIERTSENRTPDLVFNKLLDDAAADICLELVDLESMGGEHLLVGVTLSSTLETDRQAIEAALSRALLRFHGHNIPVGDDRLGGWTWLFESSVNVTSGDTHMAWRAVCTALLIHPDFYTY
jgi:hypothetical protein